MTTDFGKDISCTTELRTGRYVTGPRLVAEACYRRLTTARGQLLGGPDEDYFGIDLTAIVGSVNAKDLAASLPDRVKAELEKDERLESVEVTLLVTPEGAGVAFTITILAQTGLGPFTLVVKATALSVELLNIEAEG